MEDLTELRQRLRTQRPVPWEQLPEAIEKAAKVDEALNVVIHY